MKKPYSIKGSDYLTFRAHAHYWGKGIYTEGAQLIVDGQHFTDETATPDAIAPDSVVIIWSGDVFDGDERLHSLIDHYEGWAQLNDLKQRQDDYNARLRAKGVTMLAYKVPCCGATLESRAADAGARWSTLATCTECNGMYTKISTSEEIKALMPEALVPESAAA